MVSAVDLGVASAAVAQTQVQSSRSPESPLVSGSIATAAESVPLPGSSMVRTGVPPRRVSRLAMPRSESLAAIAARCSPVTSTDSRGAGDWPSSVVISFGAFPDVDVYGRTHYLRIIHQHDIKCNNAYQAKRCPRRARLASRLVVS
jgi:hypothetical protein